MEGRQKRVSLGSAFVSFLILTAQVLYGIIWERAIPSPDPNTPKGVETVSDWLGAHPTLVNVTLTASGVAFAAVAIWMFFRSRITDLRSSVTKTQKLLSDAEGERDDARERLAEAKAAPAQAPAAPPQPVLPMDRAIWVSDMHPLMAEHASKQRIGFSFRVFNANTFPIRLRVQHYELLYGDRVVHHIAVEGLEPLTIDPGKWAGMGVFIGLVDNEVSAQIREDISAGLLKQIDFSRIWIEAFGNGESARLNLPHGAVIKRKSEEWAISEIVQIVAQFRFQ